MAVLLVLRVIAMHARCSSGSDFVCGQRPGASMQLLRRAFRGGRSCHGDDPARESRRQQWMVECRVACGSNDGGDSMVRKITSALAAVAVARDSAAAATAEARRGGGGGRGRAGGRV